MAASKNLENINFEFGFNLEYLKSLNKSFEDFNWNQHERFLNTFKHYRTELEGIDLHFLRHDFPLKKGQQKIPILLMHGFGSSFWDFYKIIPVLSNPTRFGYDFGGNGKQIVFDVIVPSLPGFGFSEAPIKPGLGSIQSARIFGKLMERIGHEKYFVHGSSVLGSQIASNLALIRPKNVLGIHLANPFFDFEANLVAKIKWFSSKILKQGFNDLKIPRNIDSFERPDTYGLSFASSSFSATCFLFDRWAKGINHPKWKHHPQGGLQSHNTVDELITEAHIFWLSENSANSLRFLHFSENDSFKNDFEKATITIPTGILLTPRTPHITTQFYYSHKFEKIIQFFEAENGGEFVAIENSELLAKEIFSFVELVLI
uniref:Epoxide hydrolase n=1 Tax=Panagrolaimus sp. PS1159 TaxID=55785 RepID=A0AC35FC49_9BILA